MADYTRRQMTRGVSQAYFLGEIRRVAFSHVAFTGVYVRVCLCMRARVCVCVYANGGPL